MLFQPQGGMGKDTSERLSGIKKPRRLAGSKGHPFRIKKSYSNLLLLLSTVKYALCLAL